MNVRLIWEWNEKEVESIQIVDDDTPTMEIEEYYVRVDVTSQRTAFFALKEMAQNGSIILESLDHFPKIYMTQAARKISIVRYKEDLDPTDN